MLYLGDEQVTRNQVAAIFGFTDKLKQIEKAPSFEVVKERKWVDRYNHNLTKAGAGMGYRTHFAVTDPRDNLEKMFRYVKQKTFKTIKNELKEVFEPRQVDFLGIKNAFKKDLDLGVWYYMHPDTEGSPIRAVSNSKNPAKLTYIDTKARAQDKIEGVNRLKDAMNHAGNLNDAQAITLAKGMGMKNVDRMDVESVKADLLVLASTKPKEYLEKATSELTLIEGKIYNLIDSGIFKLEKIGAVRRWIWTEGVNQGGTIIEIVNITVEPKTALINHLLTNLNEYLPSIINYNDTINSKRVAESYIEKQAEKEEVKTIGENLPEYLKATNAVPENFQEMSSYMLNAYPDRKRPANAVISQTFKKLQEGELSQENLMDYVGSIMKEQ